MLDGIDKSVKTGPENKSATTVDAKTNTNLILTVDPFTYVHIKSVRTSKYFWKTLKTLFVNIGFDVHIEHFVCGSDCRGGTGFGNSYECIGSMLLARLGEVYVFMIMSWNMLECLSQLAPLNPK